MVHVNASQAGASCTPSHPSHRMQGKESSCVQVKLWTPSNGFCFVTFAEHTAPVTGLAFLPNSAAVVSSSLDGTVRAFDLIRYRNFRTMTSPTPQQFGSLAVDPSGEVRCPARLYSLCMQVVRSLLTICKPFVRLMSKWTLEMNFWLVQSTILFYIVSHCPWSVCSAKGLYHTSADRGWSFWQGPWLAFPIQRYAFDSKC